MLTVSTKLRPDSNKLLQLPSILNRINLDHLKFVNDEELNQQMLSTIKIPKNLKYLSETLPEPNYQPPIFRTIEKGHFLHTIQSTNPSSTKELKSHSLPKMNQIVGDSGPVFGKKTHLEGSVNTEKSAVFRSEKTVIKHSQKGINKGTLKLLSKEPSRGLHHYQDNQLLIQKYIDRKHTNHMYDPNMLKKRSKSK